MYLQTLITCIDGVMVSVFAGRVVYRGFESWLQAGYTSRDVVMYMIGRSRMNERLPDMTSTE